MGIDGPERVGWGGVQIWVMTYTDPPSSYISALQVCKDTLAPCSFLVTSMNGPNGASYRIVDIQRFPRGGDDLVKVFFVENDAP
jgi:hypothetical protein